MKLIFHIAAVMALAAPSFAQDTDVLTPSGDVAPIRAVKLIQAA
jgi:membrane fusion protein, multidrug efflux system